MTGVRGAPKGRRKVNRSNTPYGEGLDIRREKLPGGKRVGEGWMRGEFSG